MAILFLEESHQSFIPEWKNSQKDKVVIQGPPHHWWCPQPSPIFLLHRQLCGCNVPAPLILSMSMLQPLDQGIKCTKATYTCLTFWRTCGFMEELHNYRDHRFPKAQDRSACWKPWWNEAVYDFRGIPTTDAKDRNVPRNLVGEASQTWSRTMLKHRETLTNRELEGLLKSSTDNDDRDAEDLEQF